MAVAPCRIGDLALIVRGKHSFPPIPHAIKAVDSDRGMATITISIFGKEYPVEIPLKNIETDPEKFARIVTRLLRNGFLRGRGRVQESYFAVGHCRGFPQEYFDAQVDLYDDRREIVGKIYEMDDAGVWQPNTTSKRPLSELEWEAVSEWIVASAFWQLPERDGSACLDGEWWSIQGFRNGRYHSVERMSGSSDKAMWFGHQLTRLAGVST